MARIRDVKTLLHISFLPSRTASGGIVGGKKCTKDNWQDEWVAGYKVIKITTIEARQVELFEWKIE